MVRAPRTLGLASLVPQGLRRSGRRPKRVLRFRDACPTARSGVGVADGGMAAGRGPIPPLRRRAPTGGACRVAPSHPSGHAAHAHGGCARLRRAHPEGLLPRHLPPPPATGAKRPRGRGLPRGRSGRLGRGIRAVRGLQRPAALGGNRPHPGGGRAGPYCGCSRSGPADRPAAAAPTRASGTSPSSSKPSPSTARRNSRGVWPTKRLKTRLKLLRSRKPTA